MMWLRDCYQVLFRPTEGLERVVDSARLREAFFTVLVIGALLGIQAGGALGLAMGGGIVFGIVMALAGWLIGGSLWYAAAGIVGGDGRWRTLLAGLGWSTLPLLLLPVAASLGRWGNASLGGVLALAVVSWCLVLALRAVCRAAGLGLGRGIGSLVMTSFLLVMAPLGFGLLALIGMAS